MTIVHILTQGTASPNGRAFLFPILFHRKSLESLGIRYRVFLKVQGGLSDCDVLFIDSKYFRSRYGTQRDRILEWMDSFRKQVGKLYYFDTTDSTGTLQSEVLPYVDRYYKSQLLWDRSLYKEVWYGGRIYTDYYHRGYGVEDDEPLYSKPVRSSEELKKLAVSWNSALDDHGFGIRHEIYSRIRRRFQIPILRYAARFTPSRKDRDVDISCRLSRTHSRNTARFQRNWVVESLRTKYGVPTDRISKSAYWKEMQNSKVLIAPFGWGEITLRDFQAIINGSALFKPDMSHLDTWPPLYVDGQTYASHAWDMNDLAEKLDHLLSGRTYATIAENAQSTYRKYLFEREGHVEFCERLAGMVANNP